MTCPQKLIILSGLSVLLSCSGRDIITHYDTQKIVADDWYPINTQGTQLAPSGVIRSESIVVPQAPTTVANIIETSNEALVVTPLFDSHGNKSLRLNRTTATAWELTDSALQFLDIEVKDRNREQYRFDLQRKPGLFEKDTPENQELALILIPENENTLVVLEGANGKVPTSEKSTKLINTLQHYFTQQAL